MKTILEFLELELGKGQNIESDYLDLWMLSVKRLKKDEKLINQALSLYGIPKVLLRNSIPKKLASNFVDDYEITPEYYYEWNKKENKAIIKERPWVVLDDAGEASYSLLPPPVVVSLIKQITDILNL